MRLLVFQHADCEHPGSLRKYLAQDGVAWDAVELDEGEPIPSFDGYDMLWVMGGPMDVWDVVENPWLIAEKKRSVPGCERLANPSLVFVLATSYSPMLSEERAARRGILKSAFSMLN